ncbi:universal stress protein [Fulvivirga sedimenti]|uniref:Universal stress protein n=1 Tax=Fulvivirga sedimenti TaxID=2879465 RepID=A0A9X1HN66_9BACT|nr:universal stress protein [Fulvivirga sedimenti]MCA6074080.1 universal stress protein [Fulvivirga sedimenti]
MKPIKNVLICTDFSQESNNALIYGVYLAEKIGANTTILYVQTESSPPVEIIEENFDKIRHDILFLAKENYEFLHRQGEIAPTVQEVIRERNIDLTVVGMKPISSHKEMLSGSITASLIERPCSALLSVPGKSKYLGMTHIGVATDGSEPTSDAMEVLTDLGQKMESKVSVFHVQKKSVPEIAEVEMRSKFEGLLGELFTGFEDVDGENIVSALSTYANDHNIDLLTVLHHCGGEVKNPLRRSVSKQLAFRTRMPLLILPVV